MLKIKFQYRDSMSNWQWRQQSCTVSSLDQCKKIYGLDESDVDYEIISVEEV